MFVFFSSAENFFASGGGLKFSVSAEDLLGNREFSVSAEICWGTENFLRGAEDHFGKQIKF